MEGDGNGWTVCAQGHRHWGLFGAAGLLLRDRADPGPSPRDHAEPGASPGRTAPAASPGRTAPDRDRVVLQHRALWSHQGGTWGVPGGARDSDETAVTAALRETYEEAGIDPAAIRPSGLVTDDHGG